MKQGVRVLDLTADRMEGDVAATLFFADERPLRGPAALLDWRLNGRLTELLLQGEATGRAGEKVVLPSNGKIEAPWILFFGGGSAQGLTAETWAALVRRLLQACREAGFGRVALCLAPIDELDESLIEQRVAEEIRAIGAGGPQCLLSIERQGSGSAGG